MSKQEAVNIFKMKKTISLLLCLCFVMFCACDNDDCDESLQPTKRNALKYCYVRGTVTTAEGTKRVDIPASAVPRFTYDDYHHKAFNIESHSYESRGALEWIGVTEDLSGKNLEVWIKIWIPKVRKYLVDNTPIKESDFQPEEHSVSVQRRYHTVPFEYARYEPKAGKPVEVTFTKFLKQSKDGEEPEASDYYYVEGSISGIYYNLKNPEDEVFVDLEFAACSYNIDGKR